MQLRGLLAGGFVVLGGWVVVSMLGAQILADSPVASTQPATQPATSQPAMITWGKLDAASGLRSAIFLPPTTPLVPGEKLPLIFNLDNQRAAAAKLKGSFTWFFVAINKETGYYTEQLPVDSAQPAGLGESLAGESIADLTLDISTLKIFPYDKSLVLAEGYPAPATPAVPQGILSKFLPVGTVRVRAMTYLPATKTLLISNTLPIQIGEPDLAKLTPAQRQVIVTALLQQYHGDPFAGNNAYKRALKLGPTLLPEVTAALADPQLSPAGKQWLAATVCDLTAAALAKADAVNVANAQVAITHLKQWLEQDICGDVIAYYGPHAKNEKLDAAIRAAAKKNPNVAHWAAEGFNNRDNPVRANPVTLPMK